MTRVLMIGLISVQVPIAVPLINSIAVVHVAAATTIVLMDIYAGHIVVALIVASKRAVSLVAQES